jgi:hypothetical protein
MVATLGVMILLEVPLLRSPASGQDVPSISTNFCVALPLRGIVLSGEVCWWSGVSSTLSTAVGLGGIAQRGLGGGRVTMAERKVEASYRVDSRWQRQCLDPSRRWVSGRWWQRLIEHVHRCAFRVC